MKRPFSSSPTRLAVLSILGSLLIIGAFLVLYFWRSSPGCGCPMMLASFASIVTGLVLSLRANSHLKQGIANKEWSEEQLAPLRTAAQWPIWTPLGIVLVLASVWCMFFGGHTLHRLTWSFLLPAQAISQLRQALTPRRPFRPKESILHSQLGPIHSDRWGER